MVNASGWNNFPSAPVIVNTGKNEITVVEIAVKIAPLTSELARKMIAVAESFSFARSKCLRIFSVNTIPISTIVPMAIAIPESATIFASTPNQRIPKNAKRTAIGRRSAIKIAERKCITIIKTTMIVIKISSISALESVSSVSPIRVVRS